MRDARDAATYKISTPSFILLVIHFVYRDVDFARDVYRDMSILFICLRIFMIYGADFYAIYACLIKIAAYDREPYMLFTVPDGFSHFGHATS